MWRLDGLGLKRHSIEVFVTGSKEETAGFTARPSIISCFPLVQECVHFLSTLFRFCVVSSRAQCRIFGNRLLGFGVLQSVKFKMCAYIVHTINSCVRFSNFYCLKGLLNQFVYGIIFMLNVASAVCVCVCVACLKTVLLSLT